MTDFAIMRIWSEEDANSVNPIVLDDIMEEDVEKLVEERQAATKMTSSADKKKRRRRRQKVIDDDSSVADSILSSILSENDEDSVTPHTNFHEKREREMRRRREKLAELKARRNKPKKQVQPLRTSLYPSSDEESDDLSKNPFSDKNAATMDDDDLSKNPFSDKNATTNPFEDDDSVRDHAFSDEESYIAEKNTNPFMDEDTVQEEPASALLQQAANFVEKAAKSMNPFADSESIEDSTQIEVTLQASKEVQESQEQDDQSGLSVYKSDDEEDIIESSKRLLRCVDQRLQYQNNNDEVRELREQNEQMKDQAEVIAEQLRRAVETKCDLVLAQNEMERRHEQNLIMKDDEIRGLRMYIQEILENQAETEMSFMNEIASLAKQLDDKRVKHLKELEEKESKIVRLEGRIQRMKISSVRDVPSESFKNEYSKPIIIDPSYE